MIQRVGLVMNFMSSDGVIGKLIDCDNPCSLSKDHRSVLFGVL